MSSVHKRILNSVIGSLTIFINYLYADGLTAVSEALKCIYIRKKKGKIEHLETVLTNTPILFCVVVNCKKLARISKVQKRKERKAKEDLMRTKRLWWE